MEKNAVFTKRNKHIRLLGKNLPIFILILAAAPLFAKSPSREELKNLVVKADSEVFFTMAENGYTLLIPQIESSDVQTDISPLPLGTKLYSSKKEDFFDGEGNLSTRVQFWFTFTDAGRAKIPPLIAKIKGRTYYLPFEEVPIYENPNLISPLLSVDFMSSENPKKDKAGNLTYRCKTGEEIRYRVSIQYFQQIISYSFALPKDSIFEETKRYKIANPEQNSLSPNRKFTSEKFPVAEFSWKPLTKGEFALPSVSIEAISYNGSRKTVSFPEIFVSVEESKSLTQNQSKSQISEFPKMPGAIKNAFSAPRTKNEGKNAQAYSPTEQDCKTLALLRSKEKHSPFWSGAAEKRRDFERSIGIDSSEDEPKNPFLNILGLGKKYGIFKGGKIRQIPEEKASYTSAPAALRVAISENAGGWLYVESKDFSGWVKQETVFMIE